MVCVPWVRNAAFEFCLVSIVLSHMARMVQFWVWVRVVWCSFWLVFCGGYLVSIVCGVYGPACLVVVPFGVCRWWPGVFQHPK